MTDQEMFEQLYIRLVVHSLESGYEEPSSDVAAANDRLRSQLEVALYIAETASIIWRDRDAVLKRMTQTED